MRMWWPEVRPEMRPEMRPEVRPEVRTEVRTEVRPKMRPEMWPEVRPEMWPEMRPERPEVWPEMRPERRPSGLCRHVQIQELLPSAPRRVVQLGQLLGDTLLQIGIVHDALPEQLALLLEALASGLALRRQHHACHRPRIHSLDSIVSADGFLDRHLLCSTAADQRNCCHKPHCGPLF